MTKYLIIEVGTHHKIVANLCQLVDNNCTLIVNKDFPNSNIILKDFNYLFRERASFLKFDFWDWLKITYKAYKFKRIIFSTGAEEYTLPNLFLFLIFVYLHGHKTMLCIRNNKKFMKGYGISSHLRYIFLKYISILAFETHTQLNYMKSYNPYSSDYLVIYDRYPIKEDSTSSNLVLFRSKISIQKIKVGLLGNWDNARRDYNLLNRLISNLDKSQRQRIELVALAGYDKDLNDNNLDKVSNLIQFTYRKGYLSEKEFLNLGQSCDVLFSPLRSEKAYGILSGTGSIGDAIYLKKFLIVPAFFDPKFEFNDILLKYHSEEELLNIFIKLIEKPAFSKLVPYNRYYIDAVRINFDNAWRNVEKSN